MEIPKEFFEEYECLIAQAVANGQDKEATTLRIQYQREAIRASRYKGGGRPALYKIAIRMAKERGDYDRAEYLKLRMKRDRIKQKYERKKRDAEEVLNDLGED